MKTRHFFILTLFLLAISCNREVDKTESDYSNKTEATAEEIRKDSSSYSPEHADFVRSVLKDRVRKHDFEYVIENCRYIDLFPIDGLQEIVAFSDKDYPKKVKPTEYEHFVLFCFRYSTSTQAELNFNNFYLHTQLDTTKYDAVEQFYIKMHEKIKGASKPGGLIVQEGEWVFSLVETCRETPIGGNWVDYENLFLSYLANEQTDTLTVLNADCGKMNYRKEKRTTHNNR